MKIDHYFKRIEESKEFKEFKKKNPKAYLCAGFFVLHYEQGKNAHQMDFCLPNGKIATFILEEGIKMNISESPFKVKAKLEEIPSTAKLDLDALKGIVEDEMKNRTVTESVKKIIAVLQILDGRLVWNLNCIAGGLNIIQVHVDDVDGNILKFEKHSIMEFMKKM